MNTKRKHLPSSACTQVLQTAFHSDVAQTNLEGRH